MRYVTGLDDHVVGLERDHFGRNGAVNVKVCWDSFHVFC